MHPDFFPFFDADGGTFDPGSETPAYNCIARAAGRTDAPWWPDPDGDAYWPADVPREETVGAFVLAFAALGYEACDGGDPESGFGKVALYALGGRPTHAARQLPDGTWTSKLGKGPVAVHRTPRGVEGPVYGTVCCFLQRPVTPGAG